MSIQIKTIAVTGEKQTEIMNLTTPDLRNGEALIKVHAVALCTLEQRIFRGEVKMPLPCTGGHEVSGEIVALGDGVNKKMWAPGDRVAVRLLYNCGECYYCRTGHANLCERAQKKPVREGLLIGPGGLCDYVIVNTGYLFKIPDTLSYEEASLTEPLACVVHSVTKANIQLGEDVVVIGGGIMEDENVFNMVTSKVSELTAPGFDVNIRSARFGNSAGLIGAGILAQKLMK
jgi:threonine dehydrogenase-like Zn-dependent dehydrogenase